MKNDKNDLIAQNTNSTIIARYQYQDKPDKSFQSEAQMEKKLIEDLERLGYERLHLKSIEELKPNLKKQLEKLNEITFTQNEWDRFYKGVLTNSGTQRQKKIEMIQTDMYTEVLTRDDGSSKNIKLIDRIDPLKNTLQVVSQLENNQGKYKNRYDVSILVNGLPLVHIELKKRGVDDKEAFNQIDRYARDSFSEGDRLFEFVHIFVISNGAITKYYSNLQKGNTYDFCINLSDRENKLIIELEDFTKHFFPPRVLLNIITKYCILNAEKELKIMRPYQIAATESIIDKIKFAHHNKLYGSVEAGGYIWHTTGSGKTLTSFKCALLACKLEFVKKVLFVVDRKDLDNQTKDEYEKFQKGAANATTNTAALKDIIESQSYGQKIIITTIQKLSRLIEGNGNLKAFNEEIVFIFDECHRSQFGSMHENIKKKFKKYYMFGFTGTPIFEVNAQKNYTTKKGKDSQGKATEELVIKTTEVMFGEKLHSYTILDAISHKNVLPFKVDYVSTLPSIKEEEKIPDDMDTIKETQKDKALFNQNRISAIVSYILEHFDQKTNRNTKIKDKQGNTEGFNSLFATANINFAKAYYKEFQKQIKERDSKLKVGIIYSYGMNEDIDEDVGDEDIDSKRFLESAINDYNKIFGTHCLLKNYDGYYSDVSDKLKKNKLDLLIVVDIFLTGFDAKTLNTLWVDKNLKYHGLIQSFSRTNRICNSAKQFGNIVCFRDLEAAMNEALKLFSVDRNHDPREIIEIRKFKDYLEGYFETKEDGSKQHHKGYKQIVEELKNDFPIGDFPLSGEEKKEQFITLFGEMLRLENILNAFDEFKEHSLENNQARLKQDYQSHYIELYREKRQKQDKEEVFIDDKIVFEIELIKQIDVDVDYILMLLSGYYENRKEEAKSDIIRILNSSMNLFNHRDLFIEFLERITTRKSTLGFEKFWNEFIEEKQENELKEIIKYGGKDVEENNIKKFLENAFRFNEFIDYGQDFEDMFIFPGYGLKKEIYDVYKEKREIIISKLKDFFDKYKDLKKFSR